MTAQSLGWTACENLPDSFEPGLADPPLSLLNSRGSHLHLHAQVLITRLGESAVKRIDTDFFWCHLALER